MSNNNIPVHCVGDGETKPKKNQALKWMLLVIFVIVLATLVLFLPELTARPIAPP